MGGSYGAHVTIFAVAFRLVVVLPAAVVVLPLRFLPIVLRPFALAEARSCRTRRRRIARARRHQGCVVILWHEVPVHRFVVHHQLLAYKVEAVAHRLVRVLDNIHRCRAHSTAGEPPRIEEEANTLELTQVFVKRGHIVHRIPRVRGVRDAEGEGELEALDEPVSEVVAFDHGEIVHLLVTYRKQQTAVPTHIPQNTTQSVQLGRSPPHGIGRRSVPGGDHREPQHVRGEVVLDGTQVILVKIRRAKVDVGHRRRRRVAADGEDDSLRRVVRNLKLAEHDVVCVG